MLLRPSGAVSFDGGVLLRQLRQLCFAALETQNAYNAAHCEGCNWLANASHEYFHILCGVRP
jgi:hypothetical protein